MKKVYKSMAVISFVALGLTTFAQDSEIKVPEPEFIGNSVYVTADGQIQKLEKQKPSTKAAGNASLYLTGIGKVKSKNVVQGARSTTQISERQNLVFIVKAFNNGVDPSETINIFQMEANPNKNIRTIETASVSTFGGAESNDLKYIPFQAKKYGEASFLLVIDKVLAPGEYAIAINGVETLSLFGVQ